MNRLRIASVLSVFVLAGLSISPTWAAEPAQTPPASPDTPLVTEKVRQLMQDRNYAEAIKAIDEAAAVKDAPKDYLAYLKGRAYYLDKKYDEAIAVFDQLQKDFPKSEWPRHARFAKALSLARKGDFRAAELIFKAEAEYLLSADRKQQIADIYLEFADNYFKPPKEEQKPDYQKAHDFYLKALEVGPKAEKKVEVELLVAQCLQKLGKMPEAAALYEKFIKEHADSPQDVEARFRLGECQLAQGNLKLARRTWQDLLAKHKDSQSERIAETQFNLARTHQIPRPTNDEELNLGTAALEAFIEKFPAHKLASQAHVQIALSFMNRGRHDDAVKSLKRFLADDRYKDREEIPDARNLLGRCYQLQKKFTEALATWHDYLAKHPAHKSWSNVQRHIVNTEFLMASEKLTAKDYDGANKLFADFMAKYPLDSRNPNILLLMNRKFVEEEKWDEAIAGWRRVVSKYPGTEAASVAQFSIADTLERKLHKFDEALEEYRKCNFGSMHGNAQQAIARLTAKTMQVATERVFRGDETPKLKVTTRNIESVTVRTYKVDLETYFRKVHQASGVEGLDIALIDPDKTFEFKVPNYTKYQEVENLVDVPLPSTSRLPDGTEVRPGRPDLPAGVMAVTVSSKTLETTTLVIQSDLDVIVKSSRDEVFVFAENMRTGKPWAEAKLLVSNGKQVFAEETTGKDGVFQKSYKELKDAGDVRVFALSGGNVASNVVGLQGVGVARGLADKGYIYTDRPAYRAGQLVHVRGCLRHAADDAYTIEKDKKYTVEIFDSRSRLVRQEEVKLNEFGTFHVHFGLPATSPQGDYRVLVRDEAGKQNYQGTFQVHEYQLEPVHLVVDTPRTVYYRGEEVEGTIRAAFYYGAPVVGREIRYQLADDRQYTATTDAKGEVKFKLPTREFSETQVLPLLVVMPERNLQTTFNVVLAAKGFSINVETVRPVYVAGETFEVKLKTVDAENKPIAQKVTLKVMEQTTVDGKVGERLVEEFPLETSKADGVAKKTIKVEKGGNYVLRAEGIDRFKNPISGQYTVQISDDEDNVRLRILADTHSYKVGDTGKVVLHWREDPALALVTFQGARVLDYKLVELKKGANEFTIPMAAKLAPNFDLSVAVMTDPREKAEGGGGKGEEKKTEDRRQKSEAGNLQSPIPNPQSPVPSAKKKPIVRFHEANSPFSVERDLKVKIATKRKGDAKGPVRPGEDVEVTISATDPQGKPVAAEVSLALVEQSLLDRFPWRVGAIQDFFRGETRQSAVRTTASITFNYNPSTQPINARLLAEADRLEIAKEEEESRRVALASAVPPGPAGIVTPEFAELAAVQPNAPAESGDMQMAQEAMQQQAAQWDEDAEVQIEAADEITVLNMASGVGGGQMAQSFGGRASGSRQVLIRSGGGSAQSSGRPQGRMSNGQAGWQMSSYGVNNTVANWNNQADYANFNPNYSNPGVVLNTNGTLLTLDGNNTYNGNTAINAGTLNTIVANRQDQIMVLDARGNMRNVMLNGGGSWTDAKAQVLADELAKSGAVLLSSLVPSETGFWDPAIVTDKDGKATVTINVPERSTAWKLVAKGVTAETLAGEATDAVVVKKDLIGQLKLPLSFTDGDEAEILAAVQNDALDKGQIEVTLKTIIGSRVLEEKKTIDVTAKGMQELVFKTVLNRPEPPKDDKGTDAAVETTAIFELTVKAGEHSDVARQLIPLKPYGVPVYTTASGSSTSDTTAWVEPPKNMTLERPGLEIIVGPTVEQSLIDIVLGPAPWCQIEASRLTTGMDATTSDLMAALALQKLLGVSRDAASPQAQSLDVRVRASIGLLVSSQNDDGGWSWTGRGGASERHNTSRIVWALSTAKKAGYTVPEASHNKAVAYLQAQVAATAESDYESKAILLHALSAAGQGDFALANRLYRNRPSLSAGALVYLTLAFCEMDRKQTAGELLDLLVKQNFDDATARRTSALACLPWSQSPAELRALTALAIQEVKAKDAKAKELVDWLLAHRTGHRWSPDKATGPAAVALCRWFADSRFEGEKYKLTVFVNDVQVKVLDIDKTAETQTVVVPAALLKKTGKQQVNFQVTGRGRFTYQCVLGGFVPAEKLASTTQDWRVERTYQPAAIEVDGRDIPRGFAVLQGGYSTFKNPLTQLPVGRRGVVELEIWRHNVPANAPDEQLEYLVITEPIPNGATVIEKSVTGGFERFEIGPGAITFYVGNRQHPGTIRYELYGYLPGKYRAGPTVIRNAHRPEQLVVSKPKSLGVLPLGGKSADEYKLTPQELYELGKHFFNKKEMKTAGGHLAELLAKWNTNPDTYKHAVQMLLDVHLETGPAAQVVRYFEIVKEKWPAEEIPFAKIVKVGAAYHEMGEYERSFLIFRATVESSFLRESRVAGFLQAQGEFARSVSVMGRLLREYPPDGYTAAASYALAQQVYAKAPDAAADAGLRKLKINRVDLTRRAWTMFETFLTAYPDDPAADEAAFAAANTLLELKAYKEAVAACNQYATRYPKSDLLDSYWYLIGYCHFATSQNKEALEMCKKVAEAMRTDKTTGRQVESPNKWQAIYILGQVHHSLGEAAAAITEYRRVEDRFPDAKQSIDYFTRKAIELPEVTAVKPGAAAEVELKFRNIAACDAKVYRIDLMKFSLLKRNLGGITNINLAGIRPHHEATVALGEGKDYRDRTHKLPLPLKEEGAYLVVCRGDDLHASGLVLVSPLKVEVQEEAVSGRVRTTVKDDVKDQYLRNVHVKVIGARNDDFVSGATDLRGVFVADGIKGNSTVIAQVEPSRYAFFRGQTNLTTEEERKKEAEKADAKRASKSGKAAASPAVSLEDNLLENVKGYNKARQMKQVEQLQEMYKNVDEGVKAQKAF